MVLSSVALAVTGVTVGAGMLGKSTDVTAAAGNVGGAGESRGSGTVVDTGDRTPLLSRDDQRDTADPAKQAGLVGNDPAAMTDTRTLSESDPRDIARALLGEFGFGADQFGCLDSLWTRESNWSVTADNPSSSAYGIPQALPGSKMASAGSDWATNPVTQIRWGLGYIQDRYGSPCSAWGHSESVGWY